MSRFRLFASSVVAAALVVGHVQSVDAQVLGTFRWNLAPFCNVVTVTVTQHGGAFTVIGTDDQCGLQPATPVDGTWALVSAGSVTGTLFGTGNNTSADLLFTKVTFSTGTLNGTWVDSVGNSGTFTFNPSTAPGSARPTRGELWAYVFSHGAFFATSGGLGVTHPLTGQYCVTLPRRRAYVAAQVTSAAGQIVSVGTGQGSECNPLSTPTQAVVPVYVQNLAGAYVDGPFTIVIP